MSVFKNLKKSDITTTRYIANKQWELKYNSTPNDNLAVVYEGKNEPFSKNGSTTNGEYQSLLFSTINHLFYQLYSGSLLNTGSLMFDINTYSSASQNRPTGSYFDYNISPYLIKNFPTSSDDTIKVININHSIYGSKILPYTFEISGSELSIIDDGHGNLYDVSAGNLYIIKEYLKQVPYKSYFEDLISTFPHVGNIFYAHGIAMITHQSSSYTPLFSTTSSISFKNEHNVYENEIKCTVKESEYNLSYNPTLTSNYNSGSLNGFATSSSFYPYVTTIGLYNDDNELLMVSKLSKPIMISPNTDTTIIVRWDL